MQVNEPRKFARWRNIAITLKTPIAERRTDGANLRYRLVSTDRHSYRNAKDISLDSARRAAIVTAQKWRPH